MNPPIGSTVVIPAEVASSPSNSPSALSALSVMDMGDEDVQVIDKSQVQLKPTTRLHTASMTSIEVTIEATNPVTKLPKKKRNNIPTALTSLKSIEGIAVQDMLLIEMRIFCRNNNIPGGRKLKKEDLCDLILQYSSKFARFGPTFEPEDIKPSIEKPISRYRYANVIMGENCRPFIATRGKPLNKDELTDGMKTDEELHRLIATEYNDRSNKHYGTNAFPSQKIRANSFVFSSITWQKSMSTLKDYMKEYEYAFNKWKLSGTHEVMEENISKIVANKPFSDFSNNAGAILYIHEFVYAFPSVFQKSIGTLPETAFSESISFGDAEHSQHDNNSSKTNSSSRNNTAAEMKVFNSDQAKRTHAISVGLAAESKDTLEKGFDRKKDRKRKLMEELYEACRTETNDGNNKEAEKEAKKTAKSRLKTFIRKAEGNGTMDDDSDADSQQSLMDDIYQTTKSISYDSNLLQQASANLTKLYDN